MGGVSLRPSSEAGEKELRGAAGEALEPSLCPREGASTAEGRYTSSGLVPNQHRALPPHRSCFTLSFPLCVGSVKALSAHASPPSSSENRPKPDESPYGAAASDAFTIPVLSTAPPAGSKQRRTTCST